MHKSSYIVEKTSKLEKGTNFGRMMHKIEFESIFHVLCVQEITSHYSMVAKGSVSR